MYLIALWKQNFRHFDCLIRNRQALVANLLIDQLQVTGSIHVRCLRVKRRSFRVISIIIVSNLVRGNRQPNRAEIMGAIICRSHAIVNIDVVIFGTVRLN